MIALNVNGQRHEIDVAPDTPLLWVLREHLNLTGTKYGCGIAQCGACTVHLNGQPVRSCITPVSAAANARITTIEGLAGPIGDAVRRAWTEVDVPQCGFCQSGQIMAAAALLAQKPSPGDADIEAAMNGILCRCGTYNRVRDAIRAAAKGGGK